MKLKSTGGFKQPEWSPCNWSLLFHHQGSSFRRFVSDGSYQRQGFQINYTTTEQCGPDDFVCLSDGQCHPQNARCNGETDCEDGSDEEGIMCGELIISVVIKLVNSNVSWETAFPVSVASSPATRPSKQTAKAAAEHKQEVISLNLNFSLQACLWFKAVQIVIPLIQQVVETLIMHQVASCPQFHSPTHIPPKWSASTSSPRRPGPTSKWSSSSFTSRVIHSHASMVTS